MPDSISKAAASRTNEPPLVSVIVVNWNGAPYLDACLESVTRQTYPHFELLVVDNGSTDGSADTVRRWGEKPGVRIFLLETNTGFTGGNNLAFRHARGDWLALLNNDAVADPHWLACLVARGNPAAGVGMLGGKILLAGTPGTIDKAGHLIWPDGQNRGRGTGETDRGQYDQEEEILWPDGCAALYHRALIEQTGGFDDAFFAYGDDADLGLRARLLGWRAWYVPGAVVHHHHSASAGAFSPLKIRLVERNRLLLALKDFPVGLLAQNPYWTLRRYLWLAWGAMRGSGTSGRFVREHSRFRLLVTLGRAYAGALRLLPHALRERRRIQRNRQLSSREFATLLRRFRIDVRELTMGGDRP